MAAPKKRITGHDTIVAENWISKKLDAYQLDIEFDRLSRAMTDFRDNVRMRDVESPEHEDALNAWVDEYLSDEERSKLLLALRARRHRRKKNPVTITLSRKAHLDLAFYAEKRGMTLSEAIIDLVEKANS